jgi:MtN3 and saliva related transmembrane protein
MHFTILDPNVGPTMNVFLVMANIINLIYNIPQMVKTYQTKSTRDFSAWFLFLRVVGNLIWVAYAIELDSLLFLLNNIVTVLASLFVGFYKVREMIAAGVDKSDVDNSDVEDFDLNKSDLDVDNFDLEKSDVGGADKEFLIKY